MQFNNFAPELSQIVIFLVTTKKLSSNLESLHFPMFSAKRHKCKIGKRDGHGKSRNGHGKVMEKCFVKSVGTLHASLTRILVNYLTQVSGLQK